MRRLRSHVRRDPTEPAKLRSKRVAIERAIRKLAESSFASTDGFKVQQKIHRAIDRYEEEGRREGVNVYELHSKRLWREAVEAKDKASENYRRDLQTELHAATQAMYRARPQPGTYEHELEMNRLRGRR